MQQYNTSSISNGVLNGKHNLSASNMIDSDCSDSYASCCSYKGNEDHNTEIASQLSQSPLLSTSPIPESIINENYSVDTIDSDASAIGAVDDEKVQKNSKIIIAESLNYEEITKMLGDDTFISDYLDNLFDEEEINNSLLWYNKNNDDMISKSLRKNAIERLRNISNLFKLEDATLFKSIYYFDKLCSIKQMYPEHLSMVAGVCLLISSKFNEKEYNIPSLHQLSKECGYQYSSEIFISTEIKVLTALDFRLKIVLPIDFIQYYIYQIGVIFDDDKMHNCCSSKLHLKKKIKQDLEKFSTFFLKIAAQNYSFWNYKPSILAFAVICASRRAMRIKPYFNRKLIKICRYQTKHINKCFNKLWNKYHAKFPKNAQMFQAIQPKSLSDF